MVKRYKLRFSKFATADIKHVLAYSRDRFGERKRQEYRELISLALVDIAENPVGWPAKPRPDVYADALVFHISRKGKPARHLFLYRVVDDQRVVIARLLHDSMDLPRHVPWDPIQPE